ncbi:hypothetical protein CAUPRSCDRAFT_12618 [Caulochytrium protostelioides]|uniref:Peptidase S9 prolyl oligopeptidase catalytic domain-containing protein n=1 Tax=Caulochytrium protostelioides TaxID=1555241 RepID=A0A4P9WR54_9FUNG|nr:hypothetical protein CAUPRSCDRAFT_12618 [Caulochytrium protostelioides]
MYTERFMKTPEQNPTGYERSRVSRLGGFHRQPYLLVHGMADDNVHMQNSADLVWQLTRERVHNYDLQLYPDNDHSIQNGAARLEIYRLMRRWLNAHVRDRVLSIAVDEQAARVEREEAIERAKEALREQAQKAALLAANDAPGPADPAIDGMSAPKPTASSSDASASSTPVMNVEDRAWRRLLADLETYRHATPIEPYYVLAQ